MGPRGLWLTAVGGRVRLGLRLGGPLCAGLVSLELYKVLQVRGAGEGAIRGRHLHQSIQEQEL